MIRKDNVTGHLWFNDESDDDNQHDAIDITELFGCFDWLGKGKEPSESELLKLIREKQKWFQ